MAKYLVIVESPAKVKTIKKFLGSNYDVQASNGHVRDFPKSQFGIDVEHDFEPKYITIRGKGELSVGKCACPGKTCGDRAGLASHADIGCALRADPLFDGASLLNHKDFEVRPLPDELVGAEDAGGAGAYDNHVVLVVNIHGNYSFHWMTVKA